MNETGAARPSVPQKPKTLMERIKAVFRGDRSGEVLVWVNTVRGPEAVPLSRLRDLR